MALHKNISTNLIQYLIESGKSDKQIANELNISGYTVHYHKRKLGIPIKRKTLDYEFLQKIYDNEKLSFRELSKRYNFNINSLIKAVKKGKFKPRNKSEAISISIRKNPRKCSEKTKQKLREAMLKRRANGYNWTLAHLNREPSYPEKWFKKVIENEFLDKNYTSELRFHRFSLDFAWVHKKKCIEIDGETHYQFESEKEKDLRKDNLLKSEGWEVLRLRWKELFKNPKNYIKLANEFIGN